MARVKDPEALAKVRGLPCLVCARPSDPAHIKSRGSGGDDAEDNLVPLCRQHHSQQHQLGWRSFCMRNPIVYIYLHEKGWGFTGNNRLTKV